ncbi:hypothetical protein HRM2_06630 [Desulforapulum autotrophicum HRM2]|uniref:Uncharacterized protein n=1 Tax=Desulforapulum autotrophicum (strain ATCC 43914 / DSM 3382 / VKM B-1955 / HRM2) TaxID=177437 RepID=C0QIY7_DESAH|nr:hypothetical protein [Desulforapulum autotrophicum]ACN13777.1 hypothetical protein HRM2_06630 [Desulforapulum autotrophicum HRM2]
MDNFTPEEIEARKKFIYDTMGKRGKRQIDKIGYENWDPTQTPKDPIEIRRDGTKRTSQQLIQEFLQQASHDDYSNSFAQGAFEMCLGIINKEDKIRGMYEFAQWYTELLKKEGHDPVF